MAWHLIEARSGAILPWGCLAGLGKGSITELQAGTGLRLSEGVEGVVDLVRERPERVHELVTAPGDPDRAVRMRCADALEELSSEFGNLLGDYSSLLLSPAPRTSEIELRWYFAQILPWLQVGQAERQKDSHLFLAYQEDSSRIVQAASLAAHVRLAELDLCPREYALETDGEVRPSKGPAVRSRRPQLEIRLDTLAT